MTSNLERYLDAAERENTRSSYASAIRHFEVEGGGQLPASAQAIAQYVADFAATLAPNTLKHRVVALGRWHVDHGFVDPTRDPLIRKTLRGIRAVHGVQEKRAVPLQLAQLAAVDAVLEKGLQRAVRLRDGKAELRVLRDRALVLLGFWRAFRGDELVSLAVEHVTVVAGERLTVFLPRTKGDRANAGTTYTVPALSRLCPVAAINAWLVRAELTSGPVFRRVTTHGRVGAQPLHRKSLDKLLRRILATGGLDATLFTPHSLRRGLASWATASGWDPKTLMEYVGWRDVGSALRYVDTSGSTRARVEDGLAKLPPSTTVQASPAERIPFEVRLVLQPYGRRSGLKTARRHIEDICLARHGAVPMGQDGTRFQIWLAETSDDGSLDERVSAVIDELHQIANANDCFVETSIRRPGTTQKWE